MSRSVHELCPHDRRCDSGEHVRFPGKVRLIGVAGGGSEPSHIRLIRAARELEKTLEAEDAIECLRAKPECIDAVAPDGAFAETELPPEKARDR